MKIYLAIPYSGCEEKSFQKANEISAQLLQEGHLVFSPISHSHGIADYIEDNTYELWLRLDFEFVKWADALYVVRLEGWQDSHGVQEEIKYAKKLKKQIVYMDVE